LTMILSHRVLPSENEVWKESWRSEKRAGICQDAGRRTGSKSRPECSKRLSSAALPGPSRPGPDILERDGMLFLPWGSENRYGSRPIGFKVEHQPTWSLTRGLMISQRCHARRTIRACNRSPKHMTSDHRVAGSSPSGCKSSPRADVSAIYNFKKQPLIQLQCP
jgi:hypothetical protein